MPDFLPPEEDERQEPEQISPSALAILNQSEHAAMVQTANLPANRRKLEQFDSKLMAYANHSQPIALSMFYSLPRSGKQVIGPSVRFAEVVAPCWRNCAVASRGIGDNDSTVTAQGIFIDYEANLRNAIEVPRRITDKEGRRYSADMIVTTLNAAMSVARRNAVLKGGVPQALWTPAYEAAQLTAVGKADSHAQRVANAMEFMHKLGLTEWQILSAVGVASPKDLETEHLVTLKVLCQEIKRGDKTIEEVFGSPYDKEIESLFTQLKMNGAQQTMLRNSYAGRAKELVDYLRDRLAPASRDNAPWGGLGGAKGSNSQADDREIRARVTEAIDKDDRKEQRQAPSTEATKTEATPPKIPPLGTVKDGKTVTGPDGNPVQQWDPKARAAEAAAQIKAEDAWVTQKAAEEGGASVAAGSPQTQPDDNPRNTTPEAAETAATAETDEGENLTISHTPTTIDQSSGTPSDDNPPDTSGDQPGGQKAEARDERPWGGTQNTAPVRGQTSMEPGMKRRGRPSKEEQARRAAAAQGDLIPKDEATERKEAENLIGRMDQFAF